MPNYQQAKIYKIISANSNVIYIGATCKKYLCDRMANHVASFKKGNTLCTSHQVLEHGDYTIILLENYPCNTKDELNAREQYYINLYNDTCVNKLNPGNKWTKEVQAEYNKKYRQENHDKILEQRQNNEEYKEYQKEYSKKYRDEHPELLQKAKEYRETHKDEIAITQKKYREEHPELLQKNKDYYNANKQKILDRMAEKITCECGTVCRKSDHKRHCKSKKHLAFMNQ